MGLFVAVDVKVSFVDPSVSEDNMSVLMRKIAPSDESIAIAADRADIKNVLKLD